MNFRTALLAALFAASLASAAGAASPTAVAPATAPVPPDVLDKQKLLDAQTFWDNRDWDWYKANIPFFECPDADVQTTYYYRWELVTKHLTYGSPQSGYSFTEFIDRPFWSGAYGAISCPAGHQLYEARWLRDPQYARDYARYWFRTPGAQPRNYSTWLADAVWAVQQVHPDDAFTVDLLPDLVKNYEGWAARQFVPAVGLFWQIGHDDGMEFNINSRQTKDILRGGPGYRPSFNAYMWADARAIARVADLAGDVRTAEAFRGRAGDLKAKLQAKLWDPGRSFYFPMSRDDERDADGNVVAANTLTYQSGKFAGSPHGREEIGYVPWQFGLPDPGYESAWKFLTDPNYFEADRGPTTVERQDPMFLLRKTCCWWSGQSWPYATTQTLKALANLLQDYDQKVVTRADYAKLLRTYALSHRKNGKPYLAEALHPDTGSFEGHDAHNHSEHYFHSGYCDLVITGLVGLKPADGETLVIDPLAPAEWDYFALDDVPYRGRRLAVLWDRAGTRYGRGAGLRVLADGKEVAASPTLGKLTVTLPPVASPPTATAPAATSPAARSPATSPAGVRMNYAVNNDGDYYPRLTASFVAAGSALSKLNDGNYWYHRDPPNRWTAAGSPNAADWVAVDLGVPRRIDTIKLYFLDDATGDAAAGDGRADGKGNDGDGGAVVPPAAYEVEAWDGSAWKPIPGQSRTPPAPTGRRANAVSFAPTDVQKFRVVLTHAAGGRRSGLTEIEAWGDGERPFRPAPPPAGNLSYNPTGQGYPKASASFSDRFGGQPTKAIDGKIVFLPTPMNRWTSYGSPDPTDWLEVDFGAPKEVGRVELHVYDDRGGVQPPERVVVQRWTGDAWQDVTNPKAMPAVPVGGRANTVAFDRAAMSKLRVVFTHKGKARSGVTEIEVWRE
jgi:hypothetical protein